MSEDVIQIITHKDIKALKMQLALQCSPVLAGLKISNLLIVGSQDENHVRRLFHKSRIEAKLIYRTEKKATFLLYRRDELENYLRQSRVLALLLWLGYDRTCLEDILDLFCRRYADYCQQKGAFPHEMGLLLGYPAADVYGFIINKGKNDLYTGYWKIYDNLSDTLKLFEQFNQAKEFMIRQVDAGASFSDMIRRSAV